MYDVVNKWFDNQSKFISLHDFDIVLAKVFSSSKFTTIQLISLTYKQQKLKAAISSLSFNFDLYDLLRDIDLFDSSLKHSDSNLRQFNETSNFLRNLQHCQHLYRYRKTHLLLFLFNCLNDSIFKWLQKQSHFDNLHIFSTTLTNVFSSQQQRREARARKRANRKVAKKIVEDAKSTSKLQNIDIFDSTSCNESEFELYSEVANFLQSLQQCQHQYRKSDLLNLLSKCLCDLASEWFKTQSEFISLKRFNRILAKTFSEASLRRASSRSSNLQLCTLVAISKSMKNASDQQVVQTICKLCKQSFNFNEKLYEHIRNHEVLKLVKNSHLSINAVSLICEIEKKSSITHVSSVSSARSQNSIFESATAFRSIILLKRLILSSLTLETVSKSMKSTSMQCMFASSSSHVSQIQKFDVQDSSTVNSLLLIDTIKLTCEVAKKSTTCRHCKQTFKFKELLRKHKREQHAKKFVINSSLLSHALNSMCKEEEKSAVKNVTTLSASQELQISAQKHQKIDVQKHSAISSSLSINTVKSTCESEEKSASACSSSSQKSSIFSATSRNLVTDTRISLRSVSSKDSNLSIATLKITSERVKNASIQRIVCVRTICKRCKQNFNFNNKLHEHIRQHHARKSIISKSSDLRVFASESLCNIIEKSAVSCSFTSRFASSIFSATSTQILWRTRIFNSISSNRSNLSLATYKIASELTKNVSFNCSLTSSLSSFRISVRKHHEFHMQKSYLTMNDLSRMFIEKFKSFDLRSHQDRSYSSQSFDIRQSSQSCFSTVSKKSYLIIENLFEMFDEKFRKKSMFQNQKNVFSREFFSKQLRITVYFKFTINQKSSISQSSKSSKSKSLNQHMSTKSIRIAFNKNLSDKTINLSYKSTNVFCVKNKSLQVLDFSKSKSLKFRTFTKTSFLIFVLLRLFSIFLLVLAFVSIISTTRMNCINVYEQVVSIIDRVIQ